MRKIILFCMLAFIGVNFLFPPKVAQYVAPYGGASISRPLGRSFILLDPLRDDKKTASDSGFDVSSMMQTNLEWGTLLFQTLVLAGIAGVTLRFAKPKV